MEVLTFLTDQLKENLSNFSDIKLKKDVVFRHIDKMENEKILLPNFPSGLDWFNVSQPLDCCMLEGKILVLDFFTYCCINCLHVIPHLRQLEEKHSIADGLVVVGIHSAKFENEKDSGKVLLALNRYNISHPVVNDKDCSLWNKLQISCWPTILIVGPNRKILFALIGEGHQDELFFYVESALQYYSSLISSHALPLLCSNKIITSSVLKFPSKITKWEDKLAVADSGNHRIIIFDTNDQIKFIIGGNTSGFKDGSFEEARFDSPQGLTFYNSSKLYIADTENHAIRLACLKTLTVKTVVGNGRQGSDYIGGQSGTLQEISSPWDVCIVPSLRLPPLSSKSATLVSNVSNPPASLSPPFIGLPPPPPPPPPPLDPPSVRPPPPPPPPLSSCALPVPSLDSKVKSSDASEAQECHVLLFAAAGTHQIWAYFIEESVWWKGKTHKKNVCLSIAGTGREENRNNCYPNLASFAQPSGLSYCKELNAVFIADSESSTIRKMSLKDGSVSHVVGGSKAPDNLFAYGDVDGKGYDVKLQHPLAVAWNIRDKRLYICDTYNHKIKVVDPSDGTCITLFESPNLMSEPSGCCLSEDGHVLYVCDTNNNEIKIVNLTTKETRKVALKEDSGNVVDTPSKSIWQAETCLGEENSTLKLQVEFFPKEIHGKWKIILNNDIINIENEKGNLDSNVLNLNLYFRPSYRDQHFKVLFDLVLCGTETCDLKKIALDILVKRKGDGPTNEFCKVVKYLT